MYAYLKQIITFSLFTLTFTTSLCASETTSNENELHYKITKNDYAFSTVFEMASGHKLLGSIVKSAFHLRTHYDLYDEKGLLQGQGICRLLTLGTFFSWGVEIDVYNVQGQLIGSIDGQVATTEPAKFSIYDSNGNRLAIAYLEQNRAAFSIVNPENTSHIYARLHRKFILDTVDYWNVSIYERDLIPEDIIHIFSAFAVDSQNDFREDR